MTNPRKYMREYMREYRRGARRRDPQPYERPDPIAIATIKERLLIEHQIRAADVKRSGHR